MTRPTARIAAVGIGAAVFAAVFAAGTLWMRHICMPWEVHAFKWACEVGLWFPTLAAVLGGATAGSIARVYGFLFGLGATHTRVQLNRPWHRQGLLPAWE